jgi:integrase
MGVKWIKTKFPGIRYYEHKTRNYNACDKDRYYTIRYKLNGKDKEEALGWASAGWTKKKAAARLYELKENQRTGIGEKTLAEKREASAERDRVKQEAEEQTKKENISFNSVFDKYIEQSQHDKDSETFKGELWRYNKWLNPLFGKTPMKNISPFILEKLKKQMFDAGKAPKTIRHVLAIIQQVFNYAKNHDLYNGDNPVSKVKKPSEDNRRSRFLSHEEAALLLDALQQVSPTTHNMALLSLHCGLRAGEIFSLTWNDIDFRNGTILIKDTKSGRNRNAVMTSDVREMLDQRSRHKTSDLVFPSRTGTRMEEVSNTFDRVINRLGLNTGVKDRRHKVVFHTLRHTYASWLVMSGVDLYTVQRLMGHSTISMTERYSHLAPDHLRKAVSKLEDSINQHKQSNIVEFSSIKQSQRQ